MSQVHQVPPTVHRLFAITLASFAFVNAALGAWYGDWVQASAMAGIFCCCVPYGLFCVHLRPVPAEIFLHGLNVLCLAVVQWSMPDGPGAGPLYIAFGLSTLTFSTRNSIALAVMALGAALVWSIEHLAWSVDAVPPAVSLTANLVLFGAIAYRFVGGDRRRATRAIQRISDVQASLLAEEQGLTRTQASLVKANDALKEETLHLSTQLTRETEATQQLAAKRADEASLVQAIHHDLREPLRSIVSFTQLIRRKITSDNSGARANEYLAFAEDAGQRMVRMLDDLLVYSDVSHGEELATVDLNQVVNEVRANLIALTQRKEAVVAADPLPCVAGYRTQLVQLIQNLVSNALKFSRPGVPPRVEIDYYTSNNTGQLRVHDNGVGIAADKLSDVFGLFNRASETQGVEGSGVGLALCSRIASAHGARLHVNSIQGEGTCFYIEGLEQLKPAPASLTTATPQLEVLPK